MVHEPPVSRQFSRGFFFFILVAAYLLVHLKLEVEFWFHPDANPFAKFANGDEGAMMDVANKAYLAKSSWFLLTILLVAFRIPCHLAFGIGAIVYGLELLWFFGFAWMAWGCIGLGTLIVAEAWIRRRKAKYRFGKPD